MIKSFKDKESKDFYKTGKSKKLPPNIHKVTIRKLDYLNGAYNIEDLKEFYSIKINKQYRVIFKFINNNAYDVSIVDYH